MRKRTLILKKKMMNTITKTMGMKKMRMLTMEMNRMRK